MTARRRLAALPLAQQAGMLCGDQQFRNFVSHRLGLNQFVGNTAAAEYLRRTCGIDSRRDLDTDAEAAAAFAALRTEFDAWRGRIAKPER